MTSSNKPVNKVPRRVHANTNGSQLNRADIIQMLHDNFFQTRRASEVVDANNNNGSMLNLNVAPVPSAPVQHQHQHQQHQQQATPPKPVIVLKDFTNQAQQHQPPTACELLVHSSRLEKATLRQQERRRHQKSRHSGAINRELTRLRDLVPSVAHSEASDLTIINEAISLICDLESQVLERLQKGAFA